MPFPSDWASTTGILEFVVAGCLSSEFKDEALRAFGVCPGLSPRVALRGSSLVWLVFLNWAMSGMRESPEGAVAGLGLEDIALHHEQAMLQM